jgi:GNAT superfamily N-acetyltransferase
VAESGDRVVGYLTGCPDSAGFRRARRLCWTPRLLLRIAARRYPWNPDATRVARQSLGLAREPERSLRRVMPRSLERDYPAHLHMNVDAAARGHGIGRALVERYTADLAAAGVAGLHLVCGVTPRPFYQRLGFVDLGAVEFRPGVWIFGLGRRVGGAPASGRGSPPCPS